VSTSTKETRSSTPLDALLRSAARKTDDSAVRQWLSALLASGETSTGGTGRTTGQAEAKGEEVAR
jgi:hypothetical protein